VGQSPSGPRTASFETFEALVVRALSALEGRDQRFHFLGDRVGNNVSLFGVDGVPVRPDFLDGRRLADTVEPTLTHSDEDARITSAADRVDRMGHVAFL
jgi:hypothetical protein